MKIFYRLLALTLATSASAAIALLPGVPEVALPENAAQQVTVEPLPLQAACPGALVEVGGVQGTDLGAIARLGSPLVSVHGAELNAEQDWARFQAEGYPQSTELLSANQVQAVDRPRLRGLAATNCSPPTNFGYFVSGNSGPGNESILILGNPNQVEVLVELEVVLESGVVTERIPVAAGEQKAIPLVSLSSAEPVFAFSFRTSGLPVSAYLQHRTVDGLTATGVDLIPPQVGATSGVIPGIEVPTEGFAPAELRIHNPGLEPAEVVLQIANGSDFDLQRVVVAAGATAVELLELKQGANVLFYESDQPVVIALRNQILDEGLDFSWLTPADLFDQALRIVVSRTSTIYVVNPTVTTLNLVIEGPVAQSISVPSRSQLAIPATPGSYRLIGSGNFHALVSIKNSTGYATITPTMMRNFGEQLEVLIR